MFITLTKWLTGRPIAINTNTITYLEPTKDEGHTHIYMISDDKGILVNESFDIVMSMLNQEAEKTYSIMKT